MKKFKAFPNKQFRSQNEYFDFCDSYRVYGNDAYALKKEQDKRAKVLEPVIRPIRKKLNKLKLEGIDK